PIFAPHLHDVRDEPRFIVEAAPEHLAWIDRIVLEGEERQLTQFSTGGEVVNEAVGPWEVALRVRPGLNILILPGEYGAHHLQLRIELLKRGSYLQIQLGLIFR